LKGIGRAVRKINSMENNNIMLSVFYPAINQTEGPYTQIFIPSEEEALNIFIELGADKDHISELIVEFTNNANILDDQPLPVILFSPGIGVDRDLYTSLIKYLVENRYVVVTIGHILDTLFTVMEDGEILFQDESVRTLDFTDFQALKELLETRVSDIITVLDNLEDINGHDPLLKGIFNLSNTVGVGHSLGGAAMLETARKDSRLKACISLDGSLHLLEKEGEFHFPVLNLRQEQATCEEMMSVMKDVIAEAYTEGQEYLYQNSRDHRVFAKIRGADHMSFSDIPLIFNQGEDEERTGIYEAINEAVGAFLLRGQFSSISERIILINENGRVI
jgi:hypothetical protein